jgi:hypothetical protein
MNTYTDEFGASIAAAAALDSLIVYFRINDCIEIADLRKVCNRLVREAIARRTIQQLKNPSKAAMPSRISTEAHWDVRLFPLVADANSRIIQSHYKEAQLRSKLYEDLI